MIVFGILFCMLHLSRAHDLLEVIEQQVILPGVEEMAIQFRVVVRNNGTGLLQNIVLKPAKCCFYEDTRKTCQMFHPIGDKLGYIGPNDEHSLEMIYVNYYVSGRNGECNATLNHDSTIVQDVHFGVFNTTLSRSYPWLPTYLREWLTGSRKCLTIDQDASRNCEPVNCLYKYDGRMNYFDETKQLCTKTRECSSDPNSTKPGQRLNIGTNSCESLESNLTMDDFSFFQQQDENFMHTVYKVKKVKEIICVHGKLNPNNRSCQCDYGWLSDPHDRSPYDPITQVYYLCNTHGFAASNKLKKITSHLIKILVYLVGLMLCACALSFLFFCCAKMWMLYGRGKGRRNTLRWFREKAGMDEEARQPLFGSSVQDQPSDAKVQHIETSWYSTGDTILDKALVHTINKGKKLGELDLNTRDVITDLEKVDIPGYWKGTCRDKRGIFPVTCAEFRRDGQPPTSLPKQSDR